MNRIKIALALLAVILTSLAAPAMAEAPVDQARWADRKSFVDLPNGIRLAYVEAGNPDGEPLLLLHGYTDTSRAWTLILPYLSDYRILIPDQRGHGASSVPQCCYALADFAYDARLFLDAKGVKKATVAGHSLGSMVAQRFAADYPDRVNRVALLGSTALVPLDRDHWLFKAVESAGGRMEGDPAFLAEWSPAASPTPVDETFTRFADAETVKIAPVVWTSVLRELAALPVSRHAADVTAPVIVLSASKDVFFDERHHAALLAAYPGAEDHVFAGLGHDFIKEKPALVGPTLARMLGGVER